MYKKSKQTNEFQENPLSKQKNSTCKDLILAYHKLFVAENVIVSLRRQQSKLQNLKVCFGFLRQY